MKSFCGVFLSVSSLNSCIAFVVLFLGNSIQAQTLPPDVGLVTQLSGEARYWNEGYQKTPERVQAFMKIRRGDHFQLLEGAGIQLVYFQNGRQETWKGPAGFKAGDLESRAEGEKKVLPQPEVVFLPAEATQEMRRIPVMLRRARLSRSGAVQIRSPGDAGQKTVGPTKEELAEIGRARKVYQNMRTKSKPDDVTPELNFLGILADYEQFEEMDKVIKEALKVQPNNPLLKELDEWVRVKRLEASEKR